MEEWANCVFWLGATVCFPYQLCIKRANELQNDLLDDCWEQFKFDVEDCQRRPRQYRWKRDEIDTTLGRILGCRQIFVFLADQRVQIDIDPDGVVRSLTTDRVTDRLVPAPSSHP